MNEDTRSEKVSNRKPGGYKPDGTPYQIMLVDDSLFVKKQLGQMLNSEGFEIIDTASHGAEAVEKYKSLYPAVDLVTMDITMPGMDGVTALEQIMQFDKDAKVVMISALGKQELVKRSFLLGAKNYVIKPLVRKKVLDHITSVLE